MCNTQSFFKLATTPKSCIGTDGKKLPLSISSPSYEKYQEVNESTEMELKM